MIVRLMMLFREGMAVQRGEDDDEKREEEEEARKLIA